MKTQPESNIGKPRYPHLVLLVTILLSSLGQLLNQAPRRSFSFDWSGITA